MLIRHEISHRLINSHMSYYNIAAFNDLVGMQNLGDAVITHEIDTETLLREVRVNVLGGTIAEFTPHQIAGSVVPLVKKQLDSGELKYEDLAMQDVCAWLYQRTVAHYEMVLNKVKTERREILPNACLIKRL